MEFIQQDTHDIDATHAMIFLHGLGANGHDVAALGGMLDLPEDFAVRYVYPHAPTIPFSQNHGLPCAAWYDFDASWHANLEQLSNTLSDVASLVEQLAEEGIVSEKIIISGFSQGGSIALHAVLALPFRLAGVCAISSFLPNFKEALALKKNFNDTTPIQLLHGTSDEVVPQQCTTQAKKDLQSAQYTRVKMQLFPNVNHTINDDMVQALSAWVRKCYDLT